MLPLLLAALLALAGAPPTAKAFVVVAHPDVPVTELPAERVSRIFLKKETRFSDDLAAVPVDQPGASPVRQAFSEAIHPGPPGPSRPGGSSRSSAVAACRPSPSSTTPPSSPS